MDNKKTIHYAALILNKVQELFDDGDVTREELEQDDNTTDFMHALMNMVPTSVYNKLTTSKSNTLQVNHIANQLCFQYGQLGKKAKEVQP